MSLASAQMPTPDVAEQALKALELLQSTSHAQNIRLLALDGDPQLEVSLPEPAIVLLRSILSHLADGSAVSLVPVHAELTTQQAADLLRVSRPYLVTLLDQRVLPYRLVGTHRRVRASDLLAYKRKEDEVRRQAIRELTQEAQDLGLEY